MAGKLLGVDRALVTSPINIPPGSRVECRVLSAISGQTVGLTFWVLTLDERLVATTLSSGVTVAGTKQTFTGVLAEGLLVAAFADGAAAPSILQETWVQCLLQDATRAGNPTVAVILQGWVGADVSPVWPEDPLGAGIPQDPGATVISVANPAAGANWSYTLSGESWLDVLAVFFVFTTDVNVGNRFVTVIFDDGATRLWAFVSFAVQVAALGVNYHLANTGVQPAGNAANFYGVMPPLALPIGARVLTSTAALQVGDQFSSIRLLVRRRAAIK